MTLFFALRLTLGGKPTTLNCAPLPPFQIPGHASGLKRQRDIFLLIFVVFLFTDHAKNATFTNKLLQSAAYRVSLNTP